MTEASLRAAEHQLIAAILARDIDSLDALMHEDVIFTGPDGQAVTKQDDLASHRSGTLQLTRFDLLDLRVHAYGSTGVTRSRAALAGSFQGEPFAADFHYTRTWTLVGDSWQIVDAHAHIPDATS